MFFLKAVSLVTAFAIGHILLNDVVAQHVTVDGNWSPWSKLETPCQRLNITTGIWENAPCGGGLKKRFRSCTNPSPQGLNAKNCSGVDEKEFPCNSEPCDLQWSEWSSCSADCKRGLRKATTECSEISYGALKPCKDHFPDHNFEYVQNCNTWNKTTCPSPCNGYKCVDFAACVDNSTLDDPKPVCVCQLGRIMDNETGQCRRPDPTTSSPRPIPTIEPGMKEATTVFTRTTSFGLIVCLILTLFLFASLKIFDVARIIQMNMELSLLFAHLCLLVPASVTNQLTCHLISILTHFFFTVCFTFMLLESIHVYSLVAKVSRRNGLLTKAQNLMVGWMFPAAWLLVSVGQCFDEYGGPNHCWIQMDKSVYYYQLVPICCLMIATLAIIEATGLSDNYAELPSLLGISQEQLKLNEMSLTSAKIMQRTNLLILPLVFASFFIGSMAEYYQSVLMYGTFTTLNGCLGAVVLTLHTSSNGDVRRKLAKMYHHFTGRK